ncbi:MAG: TraB/GumN family protein [Burkholderiales bacterium]|jgi:uncharacterized protein YbaP (TraB family)|nr:TraB/GumN family protein [Burkholderiales bacterium]
MRVLWALFLGFLLAAPAWAQADSDRPRRGFWWEATRGEHRIVLMGTLHVGRSDFNPPARPYLQRLQEAAVIAVEADVFNAQKVGTVVQRLGFYADGEPALDQRLSPELRKRVETVARQRGVDAAQLWRMKPWMLANTLVLLDAMRAGLSPAFASEAYLFQFSQQTGKPLEEIESIELQLRLFDSAPADLQRLYLEQVIKSIESGESDREVALLVQAWSRSDAAAMEALIAKLAAATTPADRFVREKIIDGRHPAMVEKIEKMATSGRSHVVAVGALHFFGPNGLLELLRKRGFTVHPL